MNKRFDAYKLEVKVIRPDGAEPMTFGISIGVRDDVPREYVERYLTEAVANLSRAVLDYVLTARLPTNLRLVDAPEQ